MSRFIGQKSVACSSSRRPRLRGEIRKPSGAPVTKLALLLLTLMMLVSPTRAWWGGANREQDDDDDEQNFAPGGNNHGAKYGAQMLGPDNSNTFDSTQKRISAMNVLLPISSCAECRKVQYELSATNGCYTWQNSHPQLVSMTDAYGRSLDHGEHAQSAGECINRVTLQARTLKETKSIILITARDINSGTVLKCNTKVGQIDRLDIFTRQKQFSVNSNQHLAVVGYDDDDNIFSSMDGFQFDWSVTEGNDIVKKFSAPDTGSKNLHHTDYFFIRSMKAGFATVAVRLEEPGYESVKLVTKKLTVVDPFIILPAEPIYILPTSEFPFTLAHLDMDSDGMEHRQIKIPDPQFKWSTTHATIGSVKDDGKFQSKVTEGEAPILVVDQQMKNNTAEGSINVVYPYRLEVKIRDVTEVDVLKDLHSGDDYEAMQAFSLGLDLFDNSVTGTMPKPELDLEDVHILIEEHQYLIKMYLYDKDGHKITLTDNLRFKSLNLDDKWIEVVKKNKIGSEIVIKTKKIQDDKVRVNSQHKLDEIIPVPANSQKYTNFANRLTQDKELVITKPVKIQHPTNLVLLPFLPAAQEAHGTGEIWNLGAKGGSGVYIWSIIDTKVATVQGSATVKSVSLGKTQLICRDQKNFNNWDSINIEVAQLNQLSWIEEQVEIKARPLQPAAVPTGSESAKKAHGEVRVLSLFALDSKGRKFTNCTAVRPAYELRGETFIRQSEGYDSQANSAKYSLIKSYVADSKNEDLLVMRQRFDEQLQVTYTDELSTQGTPQLSEVLMRHNNFGICAQQEVQGENEGLARLKASFVIYEYGSGPGRVLESEFAEIAVYNQLTSVAPLYQPYMSDLYSVNQLGQEFQSFEGFYQDWTLSLQYGSSINWRVVGGSNFWPDQVQNYRTSWASKSLSSQKNENGGDMIDMRELSILTTESTFGVRCMMPKNPQESYRARITLQQASRGTRSLMRPANHETEVDLHCEPPKSVKLTWAQEQRFRDVVGEHGQRSPNRMLPRSRIVKNERTHFVLVNSRHSVRYLMLDHEGQVSFNSSSVLTNVEASDPAMAEIMLPSSRELSDDQRGQPGRSYAGDVLDDVYDRRTVQFRNLTGRVYLTATASHYLEDFAGKHSKDASGGGSSWFSGGSSSKKESAKDAMKGVYKSSITGSAFKFAQEPARSQMTIEVVRNVDVEPKFKSLYIGAAQQTYRLRILHGSGSFAVSVNATGLVDLVQKDREILLTPKELGGLRILVEDLELPQSEVAVAEVLISDIAKLTLWAPLTLIEVKDEMELTVSAYDTFMNEFDPDQYALMNFNIETETMGLRRTGGLQSTQVPEKIRNFNAYGREPGVYQLTAFTYAFRDPNKSQGAVQSRNNGHSTIVSEMVRIEVFPLLEIYPSNLLITPNMRYTLQIVGGPQTAAKSQHLDGSHVEIKFDIENKKVATIDRFREVTGHEVGDAVLKYEIIQLRTTQNSIQPHLSVDQDGKGVIAPVKPQSKVVSKKTVKIRVRLVTEIEIPFTHQRQIYSGSFIKMMAVLKFGEELFHHGIAPISYSWNCTEGRVLALDIPTKQELANSLVMTSRYIRDNEKNNDKVEFFTSFNSSSIYAMGEHEGETLVSVLLAIEYPEKYRREQNWYRSSVTVKVTDRLMISVPQYSTTQEKETHMYLVPPHTQTKIETNKKSRLKLGYSQQSVFDYSTQQYKYQETNSPIIELVNDEAIRTFDKYGKVTLLVEEGGAFSDQIVMLNVKIADVYALSTMQSYDALSLPLGSSLDLPIHLQDDHAHKFAQDIAGVPVGIYLSHPKVVSVTLDQYNQTLTIQSMGQGDCNIFLFLEDHPHIFDVIRVRVSGVVQPLSPVFLNLGGEINFRLESTDHLNANKDAQLQAGGKQQVLWNSGNTAVLSIEPQSGRAVGRREGKADVLLSNHLNAASIVHVSKVAYGQLDQKSQLIINADNQGSSFYNAPEYRVRIKLFLDRQAEEMMPTVQFDGITLIRQRIGIQCESSNKDFVLARGEVNDLEGFFCVMSYVQGADIRGMPKFVKITATATGEDADGKVLYQEKVTDFEMQLISEIQVETKFMNGIDLCQDKRTESIKVWSSSDFKVDFKYAAPEEGQLVLHQLTPVNEKTNEYNLTVQIPAQVSHQFDVSLVLSHQFASKPRSIPLRFKPDTLCKESSNWFGSSSYPQQEIRDPPTESYITNRQEQPQQQIIAQPSGIEKEGASWVSYLIFFSALILILLFVVVQFFQLDLHDLYDLVTGRHRGPGGHGYRHVAPYGSHNRYQNERQARYQANLNLSGDGIRESRAFQRAPLSRDNTFGSFGNDFSGHSGKGMNRSRTHNAQQPHPLHFDDISMNNNRQRGDPRYHQNNSMANQNSVSANKRHNRNDSIQDSSRYY